MDHPPDLDGPLPDIYRSREAFFASLPGWRRFLAKLNWHPIIDLMVKRYAWEQEDLRLDRLASAANSPTGDALLAELNAELNRRGSTRTTITDLPAEPTAPRPEQASTAPSRRNAVKATLLLLLGIGIAILLFTSPWFWLLLLAGFAVWVVVGLLGFIWKAIYDTLQEGDQPPPP
jgi:Flp pilus assembly protein TadB